MTISWDDMRQQAAANRVRALYGKGGGGRKGNDAIAAVGAGADPEWLAAAEAAVRETAARYRLFTTDEVLQAHPELENPREPKAWGWVMRACQNAGVCASTSEWWKSSRPSNHAREKRVWRSLVGGTDDPRLLATEAEG